MDDYITVDPSLLISVDNSPVYIHDHELDKSPKKWECIFVYLNHELVYVTVDADKVFTGKLNHGDVGNKHLKQMYKDGTVSLLDLHTIRTFSNEDEALMFKSFCVDKFLPKFNPSRVNVEDKVFVKQTRLNDKYRLIDVPFNDVRMKAALVYLAGYNTNIVAQLLEISQRSVDNILSKSEDHRNIIQPFEYVGLDGEIHVDGKLLSHFKKMNRWLIDQADVFDTPENW